MNEKKKYKRSKEEIAKEFDLPERKSKIATIMKHDGEAYCICRSSDCSRFMIGCDGCEEWYHGDCINVTEKEAKHIKHYYCQSCKESDPSLQTVFRMVPVSSLQQPNNHHQQQQQQQHQQQQQSNSIQPGGSQNFIASNIINLSNGINNNNNNSGNTMVDNNRPITNTDDNRKYKRLKDKQSGGTKSSKDRCGYCIGCVAENCGECRGCISRICGSLGVSSKKQRCENRQCINIRKKSKLNVTTVGGGSGTISGSVNHQLINNSTPQINGQQQQQQQRVGRGRPKKRRRTPSPELIINPELEGIRQCYGPACKLTARQQSKYCSDTCGMKLATSRIYRVLPQRIQEWNLSACHAEEQNKKLLDTIRAKQLSVRATLAELDKRQKELDLLVDRAKRCTLDPAKSFDSINENAEDEMSMYCVTCGHEIHSKTAIRHMEKCFNKYESQASFGSIFKTRIDGNTMFCDFYNVNNKTYCKRLRVLCPEHCKDPKVNDSDVCGCPLVHNVFQLTGEFCRAPKKNCFKHYVWEKVRRAEIDLERVRQWLKMDELMEQERQVRSAMASRAGVLGLMLHSTYNHEIMEKLCAANARQC